MKSRSILVAFLIALAVPSASAQDDGACCFSNKACLELSESACTSAPDAEWRGAGTDCSDVNGDGVADWCFGVTRKRLYWTQHQKTERAHLDGTAAELVFEGSDDATLALDTLGGWAYWVEGRPNTWFIRRTSLATLVTEDVIEPSSNQIPRSVAIDAENSKIYWLAEATSERTLRRADLNGSNEETLGPMNCAISLALDVENQVAYWVHTLCGTPSVPKIRRAALSDIETFETLIGEGMSDPRHIALDLVERKMYWTDRGTNTIERANLDGSSRETVLARIGQPWGITLDSEASVLFWADYQSARIRRANFDGTDLQDVVTGLDPGPRRVALDLRTCGNQIAEAGEECDDGNTDDTDFCLSTCLTNRAIPTTTEWGLSAMMLLLLAAGAVVIAKRRRLEDTRVA